MPPADSGRHRAMTFFGQKLRFSLYANVAVRRKRARHFVWRNNGDTNFLFSTLRLPLIDAVVISGSIPP
jgi:hypothetical protein